MRLVTDVLIKPQSSQINLKKKFLPLSTTDSQNSFDDLEIFAGMAFLLQPLCLSGVWNLYLCT